MSLFKSEEEKREFLQIKEDDDAHIRAMKSELLLVMDMSKEDRAIYWQEDRVREEEHRLQWMIDQNKSDDEFIAWCVAKAKQYVNDYETFGEEEKWIKPAEEYTELAKAYKQNKYSIAEIRKQRERIQWEKRKLNQIRKQSSKPSTEPSQSSEA